MDEFPTVSGGIVTTDDECTSFSISEVAVVNNAGIGVQVGIGVNLYDPPREKLGAIRNCFIAGNSTSSPGAEPGIVVSRCRSVLIENNRFGYEHRHDGKDETTQGSAVIAGADSFGIRCVGNYVAGTAGQAPAYVLVASAPMGLHHRAWGRPFDPTGAMGRRSAPIGSAGVRRHRRLPIQQ